MKVHLDITRILHLIILLAGTALGGKVLTQYFGWSYLSGYGLACSLVCQVSNAILKLTSEMNIASSSMTNNQEKKVVGGGRGKKKKKKAK